MNTDYGWHVKTFKTKAARDKWLERYGHRCQIVEIFVNNGYGVEYRRLLRVY